MARTEDTPQSEESKISPPTDVGSLKIPRSEAGQSQPSIDERDRDATTEERDWEPILKFAAESHDYMREFIRNADQKAIFYFSVCSALLAFEHSQGWAQRWMKDPLLWSLPDLFTCLAMVGLAGGAISFLWVVFPRRGGTPRGLIFFKSVATYSSGDEYASTVSRQTRSDLSSEKLLHCYELAKIAAQKFEVLSFGLWVGAVGILCSLSMLLASNPRGVGEQAPKAPSITSGEKIEVSPKLPTSQK